MDAKREHRRQRLLELLQMTYKGVRGGQADAAARIDCDPNYLSRLLSEPGRNGHKNIGEETQDRIEAAFNLVPGWLDLPLGTPVLRKEMYVMGVGMHDNATSINSVSEPMPAPVVLETRRRRPLPELEVAIDQLRHLPHDQQQQIVGMIKLMHAQHESKDRAGLPIPAQG
jgi:hypothetical protein